MQLDQLINDKPDPIENSFKDNLSKTVFVRTKRNLEDDMQLLYFLFLFGAKHILNDQMEEAKNQLADLKMAKSYIDDFTITKRMSDGRLNKSLAMVKNIIGDVSKLEKDYEHLIGKPEVKTLEEDHFDFRAYDSEKKTDNDSKLRIKTASSPDSPFSERFKKDSQQMLRPKAEKTEEVSYAKLHVKGLQKAKKSCREICSHDGFGLESLLNVNEVYEDMIPSNDDLNDSF